MSNQVNALTIDVEDYYQVAAFHKNIQQERWSNYESRSTDNTQKLLDLFEKRSVKGTFFVLGYEAKRNPKIVRKISDAGHRIGSHGMDHQMIHTHSEETFRQDVRESRKRLQDLSGQEVLSYRAPTFSIGPKTPWAHMVLVEEGYRYDSSIYPIRHDLYGSPDAPATIHTIETPSGPIVEFPPTVAKVFGRNLPVGGGGYFRFFPFWLTKSLLKKVNHDRPFMFYLHPWEVDPEQPRIAGASLKSRFRHYVNLKKTASRLEALLDCFAFAPMETVLEETEIRQSETV